jgi:APA family basic amino acid/polyamine antiporter
MLRPVPSPNAASGAGSQSAEPVALRKRLGIFETTVSGIGIIVGAGIYVLVGEAAGRAGNGVWASFLMAAAMAAIIGLSYAELASIFPRAGADYEYTRQALGLRPAFVVGWLIVIGNLLAAGAVALGFGSYLDQFWGIGETRPAVALIIVATFIAFYGIRETVWLAILMTAVEAGGLAFIIIIGVPHLGDANLLETKAGAGGLFSAAALIMFAYIGFEQIATLAEETIDAHSVIPKAIMASIAATTVLYVAVAIAAISVLGWQALAASNAPLADVARGVLGSRAGDILALVALFSTGNTVLLLLVAASRLIYGMARAGSLPRFLAWVHPGMHTPARAIVLALIVSLGFTLSGDLDLVASATNFAVFIGFGAVNLSLIVLRFTQPALPRPFRVPLSIGRLPLLPVAGLAGTAFLMANLDHGALLIGAGLFVSGLLAMELLSFWKPVETNGELAKAS